MHGFRRTVSSDVAWSSLRQVDLRSSRGGTRTPDPPVNSRLLYQLSYSGIRAAEISRAGRRTSTSNIPARINPPPAHCMRERVSPSTSHDVTAANTGSQQKIRAARAVDMWRCALAWSTKDTVLANTTVHASAATKA